MSDSDEKVVWSCWEVDISADDGVLIMVTHLEDDGTENFTTSMSPECALEFGRAIVEIAEELIEEAKDNGGPEPR